MEHQNSDSKIHRNYQVNSAGGTHFLELLTCLHGEYDDGGGEYPGRVLPRQLLVRRLRHVEQHVGQRAAARRPVHPRPQRVVPAHLCVREQKGADGSLHESRETRHSREATSADSR